MGRDELSVHEHPQDRRSDVELPWGAAALLREDSETAPRLGMARPGGGGRGSGGGGDAGDKPSHEMLVVSAHDQKISCTTRATAAAKK